MLLESIDSARFSSKLAVKADELVCRSLVGAEHFFAVLKGDGEARAEHYPVYRLGVSAAAFVNLHRRGEFNVGVGAAVPVGLKTFPAMKVGEIHQMIGRHFWVLPFARLLAGAYAGPPGN